MRQTEEHSNHNQQATHKFCLSCGATQTKKVIGMYSKGEIPCHWCGKYAESMSQKEYDQKRKSYIRSIYKEIITENIKRKLKVSKRKEQVNKHKQKKQEKYEKTKKTSKAIRS